MDNKNNNHNLPDNVSPLRFMMSVAHKKEYKYFNSFSDALGKEDAYAIFEGDWGGQIYLVCPVNIIQCSENDLNNLLLDLDQIACGCNNTEGSAIIYEVHHPGDGISGGMGGGFVISNDIWIHKEFNNINDKIKDVISGKCKKISQ